MTKRLTVDMTDDKHAQFKSKTAAQGVTMREVLNVAIDDYLSGKYKPTKKGGKPIK